MVGLLAERYEFSLKFLQPGGVRFSVREVQERVTGLFWERRPGGRRRVERGSGVARLDVGTVLKLALPLRDLALTADNSLTFFMAVYDTSSAEIERHQTHQPIDSTVPEEHFEARIGRREVTGDRISSGRRDGQGP